MRILLFPEHGFLVALIAQGGCSARDNSFFDDELLHKYNDIYHICNMYSILLYVYVYMYVCIYIYILYSSIIIYHYSRYYSWFKSSLQCYSLQLPETQLEYVLLRVYFLYFAGATIQVLPSKCLINGNSITLKCSYRTFSKAIWPLKCLP